MSPKHEDAARRTFGCTWEEEQRRAERRSSLMWWFLAGFATIAVVAFIVRVK